MEKNFDQLKIGKKTFNSRLMLGTGKYKTSQDAINSINASECEIVTVAIRRLPIDLKNDNTSFLTKLVKIHQKRSKRGVLLSMPVTLLCVLYCVL